MFRAVLISFIILLTLISTFGWAEDEALENSSLSTMPIHVGVSVLAAIPVDSVTRQLLRVSPGLSFGIEIPLYRGLHALEQMDYYNLNFQIGFVKSMNYANLEPDGHLLTVQSGLGYTFDIAPVYILVDASLLIGYVSLEAFKDGNVLMSSRNCRMGVNGSAQVRVHIVSPFSVSAFFQVEHILFGGDAADMTWIMAGVGIGFEL
jgi:hypothetical protein